MSTLRADIALEAFLYSSIGGGTLPKSPLGGMEHGPWTTSLSMLQLTLKEAGMIDLSSQVLRRFSDKINPVMNYVQAASAGWLVGAAIGCSTACSIDSTAY